MVGDKFLTLVDHEREALSALRPKFKHNFRTKQGLSELPPVSASDRGHPRLPIKMTIVEPTNDGKCLSGFYPMHNLVL